MSVHCWHTDWFVHCIYKTQNKIVQKTTEVAFACGGPPPLSALACVCFHLSGAGTPASYCAGASPAPRADANKTRLHYYKLYEEINRRYRSARPLPLGLFLLCSESHDPLGCWQRTPMSSCKRPGVNKERQCTAQCSAVLCCAEQSRAERPWGRTSRVDSRQAGPVAGPERWIRWANKSR